MRSHKFKFDYSLNYSQRKELAEAYQTEDEEETSPEVFLEDEMPAITESIQETPKEFLDKESNENEKEVIKHI